MRRSPKYGTTSHPFTGLLICADCGGKLSYREPAEHKEKKYNSDYSFVCQHYRHRKGTCSMHYIKVKTVNEILLKSIKEITDFAKEEKQEYMGHTVLGKTICLDYKTKKRRKAKEDELIIFKNTHEAIIDEETWNNAQRLRKTVRRSPKYGTTSHPFTGLLICSDCGGKLSYREPAEHKEKKYDCDYCFVCQHYRHRKGSCSMHYIKVKTVNEILLKSIKEITDFAKEEKQEFLKVMNKLSDEKREEKYQGDKEKLEKLSSRNEELTTFITKLYEDHALGKIPVKHFDRLFNIYDTEQQDLEKQIQYFEQEIESYHQRKVDTDKFLKMIEKYTDIEELTVPMINEYIEKVVVHEATGGRKGKDRKQQVDVYFNFIGNCQVPQKADIEKMA